MGWFEKKKRIKNREKWMGWDGIKKSDEEKRRKYIKKKYDRIAKIGRRNIEIE